MALVVSCMEEESYQDAVRFHRLEFATCFLPDELEFAAALAASSALVGLRPHTTKLVKLLVSELSKSVVNEKDTRTSCDTRGRSCL